MGFDLPIYCIDGARPIKAVSTEDGGMTILVFDWDTGEFKRDLSYLTVAVWGDSDDVEYLSEEEFNSYVEKLRRERGFFDKG